MRGLFQFSKLPSLARVIDREGPSRFSIVPVQRVPEDAIAAMMETRWIRLMGWVLNKQLPFQGLDQAYWTNLLGRQEKFIKNIKQVIMDLINGKSEKLGTGDLLIIASRCVNHCEPRLFERFFSILRKKNKDGFGRGA